MDEDEVRLSDVLQKAAASARHGSVEIKAGRFDTEMHEFQNRIRVLVDDAEATYRSFVAWRVLSADHADPSPPRSFVRSMALRDAAHGFLRLTQPSSLDERNFSLSDVAHWLAQPMNRETVLNKQWPLDLGFRDNVAAAEVCKNAERVCRIEASFQRMGAVTLPTGDLAGLREDVSELSAQNFAWLSSLHPRRTSTISSIERAITVVLDLSMEVHALLLGGYVAGREYRKAADEFVKDLMMELSAG